MYVILCSQAVYNPTDPAVIVVVGQHLLKMLRLTEGSLRQFGHQRVENTNYMCAAWAGKLSSQMSTCIWTHVACRHHVAHVPFSFVHVSCVLYAIT